MGLRPRVYRLCSPKDEEFFKGQQIAPPHPRQNPIKRSGYSPALPYPFDGYGPGILSPIYAKIILINLPKKKPFTQKYLHSLVLTFSTTTVIFDFWMIVNYIPIFVYFKITAFKQLFSNHIFSSF